MESRIDQYFEIYNTRLNSRAPHKNYEKLSLLWMSMTDDERARVNKIMSER